MIPSRAGAKVVVPPESFKHSSPIRSSSSSSSKRNNNSTIKSSIKEVEQMNRSNSNSSYSSPKPEAKLRSQQTINSSNGNSSNSNNNSNSNSKSKSNNKSKIMDVVAVVNNNEIKQGRPSRSCVPATFLMKLDRRPKSPAPTPAASSTKIITKPSSIIKKGTSLFSSSFVKPQISVPVANNSKKIRLPRSKSRSKSPIPDSPRSMRGNKNTTDYSTELVKTDIAKETNGRRSRSSSPMASDSSRMKKSPSPSPRAATATVVATSATIVAKPVSKASDFSAAHVSPSRPKKNKKENILLLGMVYAKKALNPSRGQEFRDNVRCKALSALGYNVWTLDDKHDADANDENMHCNANFADRRRMIQSMNEQWGEHVKFDHIILDYFFSPVGWARTRWTERFYSETLPELARQGKFEDSGKIWLPHLQNVQESVLDNAQIIQDHFTIDYVKDPLANPLFRATAAVTAELEECPDKLSNDNQMKHLNEYSSNPFMCLTCYSSKPTIKNPIPAVLPTKRKLTLPSPAPAPKHFKASNIYSDKSSTLVIGKRGWIMKKK